MVLEKVENPLFEKEHIFYTTYEVTILKNGNYIGTQGPYRSIEEVLNFCSYITNPEFEAVEIIEYLHCAPKKRVVYRKKEG